MRVSPSEYISVLKIEQSIKPLADKKSKVLDVQLDTGYSSSPAFSKFFSRFTGLSPKRFQIEMKGLYTGLKKHEEKEEEGAVHYPPPPKTCNTRYICHVHIAAPEHFKGIIFVGLFDKPLSNRPPVIGKALVKSRICAIERQKNPLNYFMLDSFAESAAGTCRLSACPGPAYHPDPAENSAGRSADNDKFAETAERRAGKQQNKRLSQNFSVGRQALLVKLP
jgi:hypothetical protein